MSFAQDGSVHLHRLGIAFCPHGPVLRERNFWCDRPSQPKRLGAPIEAESVVVDRRRRLAADEGYGGWEGRVSSMSEIPVSRERLGGARSDRIGSTLPPPMLNQIWVIDR